MSELWEVKAWTNYAAGFPAKVLSTRKFTVTRQQAEHDVAGAFGVAVKWADQNLLNPIVVSLRRIRPDIKESP